MISFHEENGLDDFAIWICTFAQYQACFYWALRTDSALLLQPKKSNAIDDVGPTIAEQLAIDPFTKVIKSRGVKEGTTLCPVKCFEVNYLMYSGIGLLAIHSLVDLYCRLWVTKTTSVKIT